ncbi:hypothetical protein CAPTEDRAFT_199351, partial [Capitella teleta]
MDLSQFLTSITWNALVAIQISIVSTDVRLRLQVHRFQQPKEPQSKKNPLSNIQQSQLKVNHLKHQLQQQQKRNGQQIHLQQQHIHPNNQQVVDILLTRLRPPHKRPKQIQFHLQQPMVCINFKAFIPVLPKTFLLLLFWIFIAKQVYSATDPCNRPFFCISGDAPEVVADPDDCKKYFQCLNNQWAHFTCTGDSTFDSEVMACVGNNKNCHPGCPMYTGPSTESATVMPS